MKEKLFVENRTIDDAKENTKNFIEKWFTFIKILYTIYL